MHLREGHPLAAIIGRFQTHELHAGHQHLIAQASSAVGSVSLDQDVLILVGDSPAHPNKKNPLPFGARRGMIMTNVPMKDERRIIQVMDQGNNRLWSDVVDAAIEPFREGREVVIFGARDSVVSNGSYLGKHKTQLAPTIASPSATDMRNAYSDIAQVNARLTHSQSFREGWMASATCGTPSFHDTPDGALMAHINKHLGRDKEFREGWIGYIMSRPPKRHRTADSAIVTPDLKYVVLGEKARDNGMKRFPGGFWDDEIDSSVSDTALRESIEECGPNLQLGTPIFICKRVIPDWRYENTGDFIETRLYHIPYLGGELIAPDEHDIFNLVLYPIDDIMNIITPAHHEIAEEFLSYIKRLRG